MREVCSACTNCGLGGSEIRRFLGFVVLHDGEPVPPAGEVTPRPAFPGTKGLDCARGGHDDAEAGGAADGFLGGRDHAIETPGVELEILAADAADAVDDYEGLGGDFADELGDWGDGGEHAC